MSSPYADGGYFMAYQPDEAASPMGCTSQYQICNPSLSSNKCGPLASMLDATAQAAPLFGMTAADFENIDKPNGTMISRYQWLVMIVGEAAVSTQRIVNSLGPNSLVSPNYLSNGLMGSLPEDQWQLDVKYWWAIFLASLQAAFVETARGSTDPVLDPYKYPPYNSNIRAMCNNQVRRLLGILRIRVHNMTWNSLTKTELQKIRSTRHISFSLFGLYFTFITGLLIIIISYTLEPIFECLYRRRMYKEYTYLEWAASETLQLQRIAFQGINAGTWSSCTDAIPRTKPGEVLTSLALEYSPDTDSTTGLGGTRDRASSNTTAAAYDVDEAQEADLVSLDDLQDVAAFSSRDSPGVQADREPGPD